MSDFRSPGSWTSRPPNLQQSLNAGFDTEDPDGVIVGGNQDIVVATAKGTPEEVSKPWIALVGLGLVIILLTTLIVIGIREWKVHQEKMQQSQSSNQQEQNRQKFEHLNKAAEIMKRRLQAAEQNELSSAPSSEQKHPPSSLLPEATRTAVNFTSKSINRDNAQLNFEENPDAIKNERPGHKMSLSPFEAGESSGEAFFTERLNNYQANTGVLFKKGEIETKESSPYHGKPIQQSSLAPNDFLRTRGGEDEEVKELPGSNEGSVESSSGSEIISEAVSKSARERTEIVKEIGSPDDKNESVSVEHFENNLERGQQWSDRTVAHEEIILAVQKE